jgi:ABC-2 type transport system permease protein
MVGIAVRLAAAGVGAGLAYGAVIGDAGQVPRLAGAALAQWPAATVLAGVATAAFGCAPRFTTVAWVVLGAFALLGQVGPVLRLRQAAMDFSPYTHTPRIPGSGLAVAPLAVLTLVSVVLVGAGLVGFRRRDIG